MLRRPSISGQCGSPSRSANAWCLRWQATHSLVTIAVVSHSQMRIGKRGEVMQLHAAMRLGAMQEERDAHVGEMTRDDDEQNRHPPASCESAETWHCKTPLREKTSPVKLVNVSKPGPRCY